MQQGSIILVSACFTFVAGRLLFQILIFYYYLFHRITENACDLKDVRKGCCFQQLHTQEFLLPCHGITVQVSVLGWGAQRLTHSSHRHPTGLSEYQHGAHAHLILMAGPRAFYTLASWGWSFPPIIHANLPKHKAWGRHRWLPPSTTRHLGCDLALMPHAGSHSSLFSGNTPFPPQWLVADPHPLQKLTLRAATCLVCWHH